MKNAPHGPRPRTILIAPSLPHWANWKAEHPDEPVPIWVSSPSDVVSLAGLDARGWKVEIAGGGDARWLKPILKALSRWGIVFAEVRLQ
jgi:hypothetical protein